MGLMLLCSTLLSIKHNGIVAEAVSVWTCEPKLGLLNVLSSCSVLTGKEKSIWCLQEPLTIRGEGEMIHHGTGTVNDCYPPVISLFRAAPRRARKTARCMQMLVFLLQSAGLLAGLVPTCWAYERLFTAERGESLIWSLGGSSTAVLSHGLLCSSLCISVSSGMLWQRWSS